ncbi:HAD-IA family hydrolase [Psychrilyobacter sp.]|uniref:HAD-IA family hydrolase n=1 Tax=Psychrilyobacter sp. TaxID=2586924 RepID=UPI003018ED70
MKKTMFIFDFDGTIADSLHMGIDLYNNHIAKKLNCKKIEKNEIEDLKEKNTYKLLKDHNINLIKLPILLFRLKKLMSEKMGEIPLIDGIKEALISLNKMGYKIGVLTSNNKKNVDNFLNYYELRNLFEFIYSEKNIFGKDKAINKMIKIEKLDRIIYVGDETRDIEACKKVGVPIISVGWGFNTSVNLKKHNPDYLIEDPKGLLEIAMELE